DLAPLQLELLLLLPGQLRGKTLSVISHELDSDLEAEMHDALDHCLLRRAVRLVQQLDVVWTDEGLAEPVHGTDERHDELVRRSVVELTRWSDLLDVAAVQDHDAVGDLHRLLLVMRDDHGCRARLAVKTTQPGPQLLPHACIERAERLVEQEHR